MWALMYFDALILRFFSVPLLQKQRMLLGGRTHARLGANVHAPAYPSLPDRFIKWLRSALIWAAAASAEEVRNHESQWLEVPFLLRCLKVSDHYSCCCRTFGGTSDVPLERMLIVYLYLAISLFVCFGLCSMSTIIRPSAVFCVSLWRLGWDVEA